eukprot:534275-Hanusia_phi.AAC.1
MLSGVGDRIRLVKHGRAQEGHDGGRVQQDSTNGRVQAENQTGSGRGLVASRVLHLGVVGWGLHGGTMGHVENGGARRREERREEGKGRGERLRGEEAGRGGERSDEKKRGEEKRRGVGLRGKEEEEEEE